MQIFKNAECAGCYAPASEADLWDMEYWSLEQAKLGTVSKKPLDGHVVFITGGAQGIGRACAQVM